VRSSDRFNDCLDKGLLRATAPSLGSCLESLRTAEEWLREAQQNLSAGSLRSAYGSAYMCFFHSARAILFKDGYREKSHYCIGVYLEHLSTEKRLEIHWAFLFDNVRSSRHNEQYSFAPPPTIMEVRSVINDAGSFLRRMTSMATE
jgi:uncharacterized protein (UPF0332 family)